jgi:hypothetical protein
MAFSGVDKSLSPPYLPGIYFSYTYKFIYVSSWKIFINIFFYKEKYYSKIKWGIMIY